jgi:hypothetical protein
MGASFEPFLHGSNNLRDCQAFGKNFLPNQFSMIDEEVTKEVVL